MELITKILSSNFFAIFTDMIKITNNWKKDGCLKEKLDFNHFVKKRLLLLSKFHFKPIKNFNLSLCLRLQFLLQYHLIACLDEKSLQVYSQYLCKENKKLIFSIIQNEKNFEVIIKELYNKNYAHLEFLIEIFYALKNNVESFIKIQTLLNNLGFMDFLCNLIAQIEFKVVNETIFLEIKNQYFKEKKNFLSLLELVMFFIYKNKNCFVLNLFPNSSTVSNSSILKFLFTLPFQSTFKQSNTFVLRILEIIVSNMNELVDEPEIYRVSFAETLAIIIENYNLFTHDSLFLIIEMLMNNKEANILKNIAKRIDIWSCLVNNMQFNTRKTISTTIVKITNYLINQLESRPSNEQFCTLIQKWINYLKKGKYNVLSSCLNEALQDLYQKNANYIENVLSPNEYQVLQKYVKPSILA